MRGKRTDSETRVSIATAKLANPDLSTRDIAEELWASKSSVARIIEEELGQIGSNEKKKALMDINLDIIAKGKALICYSIGSLPLERYSDLSQLSTIVETAFKQNELLWGNATERIDITSMTEEQKRIIASRYKE